MPDLIDKDTPDAAKSRTGFDGHEYELVFSDEFNVDGRSFYPGQSVTVRWIPCLLSLTSVWSARLR